MIDTAKAIADYVGESTKTPRKERDENSINGAGGVNRNIMAAPRPRWSTSCQFTKIMDGPRRGRPIRRTPMPSSSTKMRPRWEWRTFDESLAWLEAKIGLSVQIERSKVVKFICCIPRAHIAQKFGIAGSILSD